MTVDSPGSPPAAEQGVSAIIPAYNYARYLPEAIASVLAQSHAHLEVIVVDDGSTDDTREVVARFTDPRVRYVWQQNAGLSAARNTGIREARFSYVAFLDADDFWSRNFLARVLETFDQHGAGCAMVATDSDRVDSESHPLPQNRHARVHDAWHGELTARHFCLRNRPLSSSVVVRRDIFTECGEFDPALKSSEDRDMWIRITERHHAWFIPEPLASIRRHGANMSRNAPRMQHNSRTVISRARQRGAVSRWDVPFWLRSFAVHYAQSAWTHHDQRYHLRAFGYLLWSVLCWPVFLRPKSFWEPPLFRLRALLHFLRGIFRPQT